MEEKTTAPERKQPRIKPYNKTMLLVGGLVVLTIILLVVSLSSKQFSPTRPGSKFTQTDFAHTSLSISDQVTTSPAGLSQVNVDIDSRDNKVVGVQLQISYDPKALTNVNILPGAFIEGPVVQKKVDNSAGVITFLITTPLGKSGVKGKGTVAMISFNKVGSQNTYLKFLPQTIVTAQGYDQSVLKETLSAVIESATSGGQQNSASLSPVPTK